MAICVIISFLLLKHLVVFSCLVEQLLSSFQRVFICSKLTTWRLILWKFDNSIQLSNWNRQITSYSIILLNSIKLLNSIISKHYNIRFALILNCHDNYRTIIMALSIFILFDDWGLWFCFNVLCRNQSIDLRCWSFAWFYLVHGI